MEKVKKKHDNIILIPPCCTYGDILSVISLSYFLKRYYYNVFLLIDNGYFKIYDFYKYYFSKESESDSISVQYEKDLIIILDAGFKGEFHICNTYTGDWKHNYANYRLFFHPKINSEFYFCDTNPLYNFHKIEETNLCKPNSALPLETVETNSIIYYKMVGISNNVRMNFFHFERDKIEEEKIKQMFLEKYNIHSGTKFNIVNSVAGHGDFFTVDMMKSRIENNHTCIDINNACDFPGWLCSLIEMAEEIHLIEGFNTNFIYYMQYKNLLKIQDKKVYLHIYARNRDWSQYNLDYSWKMMDNPKLSNWIYLF